MHIRIHKYVYKEGNGEPAAAARPAAAISFADQWNQAGLEEKLQNHENLVPAVELSLEGMYVWYLCVCVYIYIYTCDLRARKFLWESVQMTI